MKNVLFIQSTVLQIEECNSISLDGVKKYQTIKIGKMTQIISIQNYGNMEVTLLVRLVSLFNDNWAQERLQVNRKTLLMIPVLQT